jgi:hydrogenase/urease accessory protein HupE
MPAQRLLMAAFSVAVLMASSAIAVRAAHAPTVEQVVATATSQFGMGCVSRDPVRWYAMDLTSMGRPTGVR